MKKLVCIALCMAIAACCTLSLAAKDDKMETDPYAVPQVKNAPIALLYEETTDTVLFSREADKTNPPASMTKVMTATLVLEYDPELKGTMVVPEEAMSKENCSWLDTDHLEVGEMIVLSLTTDLGKQVAAAPAEQRDQRKPEPHIELLNSFVLLFFR